MSSTTWTASELKSNAGNYEADAWRFVESQYLIATASLVNSVAEQSQLEELLEGSKPPLPSEFDGFHTLLATPFRYRSTISSRFRSSNMPGVFYCAELLDTAAAEMAFHRWRFLTDSVELLRLSPTSYTAFQAKIRGHTADLTREPFIQDTKMWKHKSDFQKTQEFASVASEASVGVIRYESVRDPKHGACLAVLSAAGFGSRQPLANSQSWVLSVSRDRALWVNRQETIEFQADFWN